ncbi:zinc finger, CCHC-type containing protein, partial [Tanacetum coccineum]
NKVLDDSDSVYMSSSSTVVNSSLWHAHLGHVHYKIMLKMSKDDLILAIDENPEKYDASRFCYVYLLHAKDEALDKFRIYKTEVELQQNDLVKTLHTDRGGEYYDPVFFQSVVEGSRDQVGSQYSYCYSIEEDPRTYNEAVQSRDAAFWKEAIDDEIGSIMENNTWVLSDLPLGCKPLGCKWIFKRKMKVDGTIDKFKARLVIQGFRQKEGIDYFDTYAPVACITTIRLLLALAAIHNLVIHQMDVKTTFLNGDLDDKVYMKQPEGFVMLGEANVILGNKIKRENKGIVIKQSQYIKKILKKFHREDCSPVSTPMDPIEKIKPNTGKPVDQLEYSRAIGCLMYAMTSTKPDTAYVIGRLRRFTSNPSRQH